MIGDSMSHSTSPLALRILPLKVTMPVSGRLFDARASMTSTSSVRSSPGRSGAIQRTSLTPGEPSEAVRPMKPSNRRHHHRAEVPARTGQALEHRAARGLLVEMHRLRVKFARKLEDFRSRDAARAERTETAGFEVFERQRGHGWGK